MALPPLDHRRERMLSLSHRRLAKSSPRSAGPLPMMPLTCSFIQDFASPSPDKSTEQLDYDAATDSCTLMRGCRAAGNLLPSVPHTPLAVTWNSNALARDARAQQHRRPGLLLCAVEKKPRPPLRRGSRGVGWLSELTRQLWPLLVASANANAPVPARCGLSSGICPLHKRQCRVPPSPLRYAT
jgi:hypothetical protein